MDIQIILLLILVNILLYYRTTKFIGICDDIPVFNQPVEIPTGRFFGKNWTTFWYHLHGRKYTSWRLAHWQVIGIHTLNCALIYIVFGRNPISALAAFIFAVNPVNNQCSMWISGKGYAMNVSCALLMWAYPAWGALIYIYGTYFHGVSLLLFPLMFIFSKHWFLVALIVWGFQREYGRVFNKKDPRSKYNTESNKELKTIAPRKLVIMFKTLGYYFTNAIFALRLGFYHKYMFLHGVNAEANKESYKVDKYFFIGILLVVYALATWNIYLLWFIITLGMWCNFISFNQTIANRYLYLPNVGLAMFLATTLIDFPILWVILLTYYITKLIPFITFYKNEYWSIEYSVMEQPDFFYPWQNRGVHCFQNGNYHGSLANFMEALKLRPNDWKLTYNICQVYMLLGNMGASKKFYEDATKCTIDGREEAIAGLMKRLKEWIDSVEESAKANNNQVTIDLKRVDMQR